MYLLRSLFQPYLTHHLVSPTFQARVNFAISVILVCVFCLGSSSLLAQDYSGEGRWYLSVSKELGSVYQNLTEEKNFDYQANRISLGGVGPQSVRFELSRSGVSSDDEDWDTRGLEADIWFPWRPESRIRPYLILGTGYMSFYGENEGLAQPTAQSFHIGLAITTNLMRQLELDASIHYREFRWQFDDDSSSNNAIGNTPDATASINSYRITLRQLF